MFGVVPRPLWERMTAPDEQNRIHLQTNCLLLDDGERKVVIETGFGGKWSDKERGFYNLQRRTIADALAEINVDPAEIDDVVVSHLHFDHAGGLTTLPDGADEPVPTFPNARIHVQQTEWDDATSNRAIMTKTYLRSHLDPIVDRIELARGDHEVLPGIYVEPAPGHTWGQQMIFFEDDRGMLCFPGDVMPTANHVGLAFSMGYDVEPYTNMITKRALLDRAASDGWRLVIDHEPGDAVVHVERDPDRPDRHTLAPSPQK